MTALLIIASCAFIAWCFTENETPGD